MLALAGNISRMCTISGWLQWNGITLANTVLHYALCFAGHVECQATANQPSHANDRLLKSPDISLLSPKLQEQWHIERNRHLGAITVKPQSHIRAVWQCNKCPDGEPHIWTTTVKNRTQGRQCPYCSNKLVCLHNSLATIAPDQTQFWNHSKNKKTPDQVLAGGSFRAEWRCPDCKWEWQAPISGRVRSTAGCPRCKRAQRPYQRLPTYAEAQPACLAQWDYDRNNKDGSYPDVITLGSGKLVHWICSCCPRGQPHRWRTTPHDRVSKDRGCVVCAGQKACACNSLEALFPSIAAEFDVDKNGFAPSEITAGSTKKVWWKNAKRGSWRQTPNRHTDTRNRPHIQKV